MTGVVFSMYTHTHIGSGTSCDGVILQERMLSGIEQHTPIISPARLRNATSCYMKLHSVHSVCGFRAVLRNLIEAEVA
jgi:hypothetical protein